MNLKKKIKIKYKIIIGLLAIIFVISTSFVVFYYVDSFKSKKEISGLIEQIDRGETILIPNDNIEEQEKALAEIEKRKLESYQKLYEQNNDLVGWIQIEDTTIDFPVMQKKSVRNYYLYKNFEKKYSKGGLPFVQEDCDVFIPTDNVIIHGHNLSEGSMFAALLKYKDKEFYSEHSIINFDTIEECHQYKIIAVFTVAVNTGEDKFPFYNFIDASNTKEFDDYIKSCKKYSRYDTGVTAEYGDKLITLVTCDFSIKSGRLVIVAKRIK
ncbi:MAG TPA: class B sortase [Erysipelotrichaceae bacterium]|nr:class B sortase [Erysipelotrichia bacterium]HPX33309.1 class B sortase [Erysipelotrichaceae bacterium]HQA85801.1 class B sortase [Erysipelotrichaceae bacterium]